MKTFEIWDIEFKQYDHLYAVSKCAKVLRRGIPYIPKDNRPDGYLNVGRQRLLHRMIAICWIPNPTNAKQVHHKNGDKRDNRIENLEWLSPKEHMGHHPKTPYKRTPETIAKFVASRTGKKYSKPARIKQAAWLESVRPSTSCKFNGVVYPTVTAGAKAAGIDKSTFRVRCLSKNFNEYEILSLFYKR